MNKKKTNEKRTTESIINEKTTTQKSNKSSEKYVYLLYALIILFIALYILAQNSLFGFAAFATIIITLFIEFKSSINEEGTKKTLRDIIIAVVIVLVLFWVLPTIFLQSSSPINVVASCSMLPTIHRGDLVFVHGISNMSLFLSENHIPIFNISKSQFNYLMSNISNEFVQPFPYVAGNPSSIDFNGYYSKNSSYDVGFYSISCLDNNIKYGKLASLSSCLLNTTKQSKNVVQYTYSIANLSYQNNIFNIPYVSAITVNNNTAYENYSNPIIVYTTIPGDSFTDAQIIHRLFAALKVNNTYYLLTKGDNNQVLDMEDLNYPVNQSDVVGYLVLDIPYLGYPSLIIKGQFGEIPGCNETIIR